MQKYYRLFIILAFAVIMAAAPDEVTDAELKLREGLKDAGIETIGEVFLMRYNPPWIPGFLR